MSGNFYSNNGNATKIKINYKDDNLSTEVVETIELDKTEMSLTVGEDKRIKATITPTIVADDTISWSTSDASVATVNSNGRVVAMSEGTTTITATDVTGKVKAQCEITVTNPEKPNLLKVQGANALHHMGKVFTNLEPGTYVFSVYRNNESGGTSEPFVKENPYITSGGSQYPKVSVLAEDTKSIGTINYNASQTLNKIEITFTVKNGNSYFCGVTGSEDSLPVYYTGFSLTKQGSDKNLFPSEFLGNGLEDYTHYAGSEAYYYGSRQAGKMFALSTANSTGVFAYPESYESFDQFFRSTADISFYDDFRESIDKKKQIL